MEVHAEAKGFILYRLLYPQALHMMPNFVIRNVKKGFAGHREIFMMSL
jgi:hypothetical protein